MNRFAPTYSRLTVEEFEALPLGSFIVNADGTIEAFDPASEAGRAESRERLVGATSSTRSRRGRSCGSSVKNSGRFPHRARTSIEPFEFARATEAGTERVSILFVRDRELDERVCVIISRQGRAA